MIIDSAQEEWHTKTLAYASAINSFVEKGLCEGWENVGEQPLCPERGHLVNDVIDAIRQANSSGELSNLKNKWPPAYEPLIEILKEKGQSIPVVCILSDGSIVARIGSPYELGQTVHIIGDTVIELSDVGFFGRSPNRRYFAIAKNNGVQIVDGWGGAQVAMCQWPTGMEDLPNGFEILPLEVPPIPTKLIPFPDGKQVLLISSDGIFVLSTFGARRLLPTKKSMKEYFTYIRKTYPNDDLKLDLDMAHGVISKNGNLIAVGSQDTSHLVFNNKLKIIGNIDSHSEYPHYAIFSADDTMIAFNSCHIYHGITIGVLTSLLPFTKKRTDKSDKRVFTLEVGSRVYAGVSRGNEFIIGDAYGYLRAFDKDGESRWQHFIGSNICDMDISDDGKTLAVSTYDGFLSIIQLDAGIQRPYQIGNGNHLEMRRWIFWKNEPKPLIW